MFPLMPDTLLTSLAFRKPHWCACPGCPGFSTAMKLARTLLTGLLLSELSVSNGDLPRLGGDVDCSLAALFSNIARRLRTPDPLFEDMTGEGRRNQRLLQGRCDSNEARKGMFAIRYMKSRMCVQTQRWKWSLRIPAPTGIGGQYGERPRLRRVALSQSCRGGCFHLHEVSRWYKFKLDTEFSAGNV